MPNRKGPKSAAQTPAPKADRVYGSKKNKANSADSEKSAKSIEFSDKIIATLKEKAKKYNEEHSTKVSLNTLKAVFRRGAGAFSVSHRPNMTRNGWAFARVNKFLEKKSGKKVKKAYIQDDDLLARGGKINDTLEKDLQEFLDLEFYSDTKFSDISKSCDLSKGNCYDISEELMDFLEDKGYKNMSLVEVRNPLFDLSDAHYEWVDRPKDKLFHIILKVNDKFIDLTGIQFSKDQEGLKIYSEDEIKNLWGKIEYFKDGGKIESFKNTTFSSKSKDIRYSGGGRIFPSRLMIPSVRGGWTKEKILKYLKSNSSDTITTYTLAKFISDLDSWEELKDRLYYHGTTNYIEKGLKPSIVFSERWAEQQGGGGYGQRYWGISLTKRKRTAESFSGMSSSVKIYPVFLKKDAKVIERPDLQDASEIEDIIVELYEKGIDAVYIGGGEEELVVVNPESIMLYKDGSEYFDVYGGLKTKQLTDEKIKEIYNKSKIDWENYKEEYNNMETRKEFLKSLEPLKFEKGGTNFNDKELLVKWKKGESIGFTGESHLKAKGLIPRADGTKRKSDKYLEDGGEVGQEIVCVNCGWEWNTSDSDESDKYVCHKCGFDNTLYYSNDIMGKQNFDEFADKRLEGAEKITNDSKNKGGLSMLTYYHYNVKLPFYEQASEGGFDLQEAKEQFKKYYNQLSYNMEQVEFQELMGKMEVLGELIIEQQGETPDKLKKPMTLKEISEKHGVDLDELERELEKGIEEEKEHTDDEDVARTIALHHLAEKPDYYDVLEIVMSKEDEDEFDGFKDGGVVVGKRHSESDENGTGEKFLVESTGQVVELEGGEAVLTKESMESGDKFSFEGKKMTGREVASFLNHKYGGVEFKDGGSIDSGYGCNTKYYHGGELPTATVDSLKGGEAVITVRTMESRDKYNFNNRSLTPRQILSIINERSGGKKFERGGMLNTNMVDLTKMVYFTEKVLY